MSLLVTLVVASASYAQVCSYPSDSGGSSSGGGSGTLPCDNTYWSTVASCDMSGGSTTLGTRPSCPAKPMPMLDTPLKTFKDMSPYAWAFPRDPDDSTHLRPYVGPAYAGTAGGMWTGMFSGGVNSQVTSTGKTTTSGDTTATNTEAAADKSLAACKNQIKISSAPTDAASQAALVRYQVDNCTNQYILQEAVYPFQKSNSKQLSMENPAHPSALTSLATECQPLKTFTETDSEYSASDYVQAAWIKLLQDPTYKKSPSGSILTGMSYLPSIITKVLGLLDSPGGLGSAVSDMFSNGLQGIETQAANAFNSTVDGLKSTLANTVTSLQSTATGIATSVQSGIQNLSTQASNIQSQLSNMSSQVQGADGQQLLTMAGQATGVSNTLTGLSNDATSLQSGLTGLATQASNLQQGTSSLASSVNLNSIGAQVGGSSSQGGTASLQAQLTAVSGSAGPQAEALSNTTDAMQTQISAAASSASAIQSRLTGLADQAGDLQSLQAKLSVLSQTSGPMQGQYQQLYGQVTQLQGQLTAVTGQAGALQSQVMGQATSAINGVLGAINPSSLLGSLPQLNPTHEPHPPSGLTLQNQISPPASSSTLTTSSIATVPYEEINDPSHPFSPRWDFGINDRQYSPLTKAYMSDTTNAVYCAGVRDGGSATNKADLEVPVDVLEFRRKKFTEGLLNRITYNSICRDAPNPFPSDTPLPIVMAGSFCYYDVHLDGDVLVARSKSCWDCFGLNGNLPAGTPPPCSTQYDVGDRSMTGGVLPGAFNAFSFTATCNAITPTPHNSQYNIDKLCRDLRKPYTNLNKLKMRYHHPNDPDDPNNDKMVLKNGVPEGLTFKEYFGNHMPYPRLWDTGSSIQKTANSDQNDQPPLDTTGQWTAIVGVGREAAPGSSSSGSSTSSNPHTDQRCLLGGWGQDTTVPGVGSITVPDPISSWTELKLYQANTLRQANISCIGRYEKVFKSGSSENMMLLADGGEWSRAVISKCPRSSTGTNDCTYMSLKDYQNAGSPATDDTNKYIQTLLPESVPLTWRGYMASGNSSTQFPNFGGSGGTISGLDNAQPGDIIMMPTGGVSGSSKPGLAKLALVTEVNLKGATDCCYVKVLETDNGKFPDTCGTTSNFGQMKSRKYYKSGNLPADTKSELSNVGAITSCEDSSLLQCEFLPWSNVKLYRPSQDVRKGCDKSTAGSCTP